VRELQADRRHVEPGGGLELPAVADLALRNDRSYSDPVKSLIEEARAKGANTLLYEPQSDGAMRHGVAYECSLPPAAEKPQP